MTMDNFMSYLQQLLTMVDPGNAYSIELAKTALSTVLSLAKVSGKADALVLRTMMNAEREFEYLAAHRADFVGVPGEHQKNHVKRLRLAHVVMPSC